MYSANESSVVIVGYQLDDKGRYLTEREEDGAYFVPTRKVVMVDELGVYL